MVKRGLILGGIIAIFGYSTVYADSADISIDVSSASLQLTVQQEANIVLQPTSSAPVFGSTTVSFSVSTNNPTGYSVTMSVPQTSLLHESLTGDGAPTIPSLSSAVTESNFETNAWGYKALGNTYEPVLTTNNSDAWVYENPTNENSHIVTLAAKVDGSVTAGNYINTLTFSAVANPNAPKQMISFNGNGADNGTMNPLTMYGGETVQLPTNQYTRAGYFFNGWNTLPNGLGDGYMNEDNYTPPIFDAYSTVTLYAQWVADDGSYGPSGPTGRSLERAFEEAYLYNHGSFDGHMGMYVPERNAQGKYTGNYFQADDSTDYNGIPARDLRYAIQDIDLLVDNQKVCDRATIPGSSAHVIDLRDNKSYWIAKLADGKCWMTQNLDFDLMASVSLNSTTSDLNQYGAAGYTTETGYTKDGNDVIYWTPDYSKFTNIDAASGTMAGWGYEYFVSWERVFDPGDWYWIGSWIKPNGDSTYYGSRYGVAENNYVLGNPGTVFSRTPYQGNMEHGHVGNYYNWAAAVATNNMGYYGGNTFEDSAYLPQNSICPRGWKLPGVTDEHHSDWTGLIQSYPVDDMGDAAYDTTVVAAPIWLVRGGGNGYWNGQFSGGGTNGVYWTTAFTDWMGQITLRFGPSGVEPYGTGVGKSNTGFVRCLAR